MDYPHPFTSEPCSNPGSGFQGSVATGGYVYRGPIAELRGRYFFADFQTAALWSLVFDGSNYNDLVSHDADSRFTPDAGTIDSISSFGEDDAGNLYVVDLFGGEVFLVPEPDLGRQQAAGLLAVLALAGLRRISLERALLQKGIGTRR